MTLETRLLLHVAQLVRNLVRWCADKPIPGWCLQYLGGRFTRSDGKPFRWKHFVL